MSSHQLAPSSPGPNNLPANLEQSPNQLAILNKKPEWKEEIETLKRKWNCIPIGGICRGHGAEAAPHSCAIERAKACRALQHHVCSIYCQLPETSMSLWLRHLVKVTRVCDGQARSMNRSFPQLPSTTDFKKRSRDTCIMRDRRHGHPSSVQMQYTRGDSYVGTSYIHGRGSLMYACTSGCGNGSSQDAQFRCNSGKQPRN